MASLFNAALKYGLNALATLSPKEKLFSADVIHKYRLALAPSFRKALNGLVDKGLVDRDRERYEKGTPVPKQLGKRQ